MKTYRTLLIECIVATVLAACKDNFDIDTLHEGAKLAVSCMPSQADTTWIEVTHTIPVAKGSHKANYQDFLEVKGARIGYRVNGQARIVGWQEGTRNQWGEKLCADRYYVVGAHQPGDQVEIRVEAEGYGSVHGATTIPQPQPIDLESVTYTRVYDPIDETSHNVYQLAATFTDPETSTDYYALRLRCMHIFNASAGDPKADSLQLDTVYTSPEILTYSEPLLRQITSLDNDFGFSSDFYQEFAFFSDQQINGHTYTLHLDLREDNKYLFNQPECEPLQYQVCLYRISSEFYHYLRSINDIDNNGLAQAGMSLLSPTYSNVSGGVGFVGGYYMTKSQWKTTR